MGPSSSPLLMQMGSLLLSHQRKIPSKFKSIL
jgi:hypothetical protein